MGYVSTNVEGSESAFFNTPPPQQQAAAGAAASSSAAAAGGGNTQQQQAQEDEVEENLPSTIQDLIERPHLDNNEEAIAAAAAPMVDDDNEPAPENQPNPNETVDDIFSGWYHSGINVPFHVFAMKEPDYVMSLISTYRTNSQDGYKETWWDWKENGATKNKSFAYPEVVHNHFKHRHAVDNHNAR